MKRILLISLSLILILFALPVQAKPLKLKIACVDMKNILTTTKEMKAFQEGITARMRSMEERFKVLAKEMDDLLKREADFTEGSDEWWELERNRRRRAAEVMEIRNLMENVIPREVVRVKQDYFLKAYEVIERHGKEKKFDLIIRKSAPRDDPARFKDMEPMEVAAQMDFLLDATMDMHVSSALDISPQIIEIMDKEYNGSGFSFRGGAVIYRDEWGVPYVQADDDVSVFYGMGFAQAQDNIEQLQKNILLAVGEMASVFGPGENGKNIESDKRARRFRFRDYCADNLANVDFPSRLRVQAFCEGVNQYVEENRKSLPEWVRPISVEDVLALGRFVNLAPALEDMGLLDSASASNAFAFRKGRETWLACDPHLPWEGLFHWYEAHLEGIYLRARGVTLFGLPFIIMGHTDYFSWAMTRNYPDIVDYYDETLDESGKKTKWTFKEKDKVSGELVEKTEWRDLQAYDVEIKVKGGDTIKETYYYTHGGRPILEMQNGKAKSTRIANFYDLGYFQQLETIALGKELSHFKSAMQQRQIPCWNFIYADAKGDLYYISNASIHDKDSKFDWSKPVPGDTPDTEWGRLLFYDDLPQAANPTHGYIASCNQAPWLVVKDCSIKEEKVSQNMCVRRGDNLRAKRLRELLENLKEANQEAVFGILNDSMILSAREYKEAMASVVKLDAKAGQAEKSAADEIAKWDCSGAVDSTACSLFYFWWQECGHVVKTGNASDADIVSGLTKALAKMNNEFGSTSRKWGDIHVFEFGGKTYPLSGSCEDLASLKLADGVWKNKKLVCNRGSSLGMVTRWGGEEGILCWSILPKSNCDDWKDRPYKTQAELYSQNQLKKAPFSWREILSGANSVWGRKFRVGRTGLLFDAIFHLDSTYEVYLSDSELKKDGLSFAPMANAITLKFPVKPSGRVSIQLPIPADDKDVFTLYYKIAEGDWICLEDALTKRKKQDEFIYAMIPVPDMMVIGKPNEKKTE